MKVFAMTALVTIYITGIMIVCLHVSQKSFLSLGGGGKEEKREKGRRREGKLP